MKAWIGTIRYYLRQFIELGLLLIGVSVFAEILFGPDVAFFRHSKIRQLHHIVLENANGKLI